jgi:hypothetical protein
MSKRLFDYDPLTRTTEIYHHDEMTGKTSIQTVQDAAPYLERNKKLANCSEYRAKGSKQEFMHIATIPNNVIVELKRKHGVDVFNNDDLPKLERLLMSNEFKYLRTVDRI